MKKIQVSIDWQGIFFEVGKLVIQESKGRELFEFSYSRSWVDSKTSFDIDPTLVRINGFTYHASKPWGVFQDISPDRWGRLVQSRAKNSHLADSDFMLGVSDFMRMGALRLSDLDAPNIFLNPQNEVPKLLQIRELEQASKKLEKGLETPEDMKILVQPGSSLGGAHPKASIEENGILWIAKFQSYKDKERVSLWEAVMLDLAKQCGIRTCDFKVLNKQSESPILLVKRFDRLGLVRIPFASAMTLLERNEKTHESSSYIELSDVLTQSSISPSNDKFELWSRMVFNMMTGNTDDHLRNHGFLRDKKGWQLSPAYDLNPDTIPFEKRNHALSFDGYETNPSLKLALDLAEYFDVGVNEKKLHLKKMSQVLSTWRQVSKKQGLSSGEIGRMENAFEHAGLEELLSLPSPSKFKI